MLGTTAFDKNGDTTQPFISFYVIDPKAANNGDWVFKEQQNFAREVVSEAQQAGGHTPPALVYPGP